MPALPDLLAVARARGKPRVDPLEGSTLNLRVMPWDLHVARMQHARFHQAMDVARTDLLARTGLLDEVLRRKWAPLTAAIHFEAYRALMLWDAYALTTRVAFWDDKWTWLEQRFEQDDTLVALAFVRTLFRARDGNVPTRVLLRAAGAAPDAVSPRAPAAFTRLCRAGADAS